MDYRLQAKTIDYSTSKNKLNAQEKTAIWAVAVAAAVIFILGFGIGKALAAEAPDTSVCGTTATLEKDHVNFVNSGYKWFVVTDPGDVTTLTKILADEAERWFPAKPEDFSVVTTLAFAGGKPELGGVIVVGLFDKNDCAVAATVIPGATLKKDIKPDNGV